jgi:starch synthase
MRVLSVASECVPFVKTGGLADVVGALPRVMGGQGVDMRVLLPGYPKVMQAIASQGGAVVMEDESLFGGPGRVVRARAREVELMVLDAPHLYMRDGTPYLAPGGEDWEDNPERFAALSWIAARIGAEGAADWRPDLLQCHDWQAGLAPYYLARRGGGPACVMTVHNIAFHGAAPAGRIAALRLDPADFHPGGYEFYGQINALKAGLVWSDRITTVSPTYARELTRPEFGAGLDGVVRARAQDLSGILNGIDAEDWNPATDQHLAARYRSPRGKAKNRAALRMEFALQKARGPLCTVVSRLTWQKGLDLLLEALPALLDGDGQLILLGTGEAAMEDAFRHAAEEHPAVAVHIGYDEAMAHRLIAGADALIMPSRFEPCGLTQLYALRYGTIPLVPLTGGLADTIIPANPAALAAGAATGVQVHPLSAETLKLALMDLCALHAERETWARMQTNAMAQPVGWETSAAAYARLYREVLDPS